jgi:hypothetical protein
MTTNLVVTIMNAEVAALGMEVEAVTETEVAKMEGHIISVNSGHIVRAEGNRCGGCQLASSMKNLYELSIHSSKSAVSGRSSRAGSWQYKPSAAV